MFEKLSNLPLFQGISKSSLSLLVEKYPFHFLKFKKGDTIITKGETCCHMRFVISGCVCVLITSQQSNVTLSQTLEAPEVMVPDYLFGRSTAYPCDVTAATDCGILQIQKTDYVEMLQSEKILLYNILNYLSRNSQNRVTYFTSNATGNFVTRFALMVYEITRRNSKDICIRFKQKDICQLFGVRRATLINALEALSNLGIVSYSQNEIKVIDRMALVDLING